MAVLHCSSVFVWITSIWIGVTLSYPPYVRLLVTEIPSEEILILGHDNDSDLPIPDLSWTKAWISTFDWEYGREVLANRKLRNALVIMNTNNPEDIHVTLSAATQLSLSNNVWFVVSQSSNVRNMFDFAFASKQNPDQKVLNPQAQLYFLDDCPGGSGHDCDRTITEVFGNGRYDPIFKVCGLLANGCDLAKAVEDRKERIDFNGQVIKVSCEIWRPFSYVGKDESSFYGQLPDAFKVSHCQLSLSSLTNCLDTLLKVMAAMSNLTVVIERFRDKYVWGALQEDGSWSGAVGDVVSGNPCILLSLFFIILAVLLAGTFDASVAGFTVNEQRSMFVDFLPSIAFGYFGIVIRRPSSNDISMRNYIDEFTGTSWLFALVMFLVSWSIMVVLLSFASNKPSNNNLWNNSILVGTNFILRSLLNKVLNSILKQQLLYFFLANTWTKTGSTVSKVCALCHSRDGIVPFHILPLRHHCIFIREIILFANQLPRRSFKVII